MRLERSAAVVLLAACGPAASPTEPASDGTGSTGSSTGGAGEASDGQEATTSGADTTASGDSTNAATSSTGETGSGWGAPEEVWVFSEPNTGLWRMSDSSSAGRLDIGSGVGESFSGHWVLLLPDGPATEATEAGGPTASSEDAAYWWGNATAYRQAFANGSEPEPLFTVVYPRSVAAVADGAVFVGTVDDGHHLFHAPLRGDATDFGPILGTFVTPIGVAIAGDGDRVWLEAGDGSLQFFDLTSPTPTLVPVGGAQSDPASHYLWATDDTILGHSGFEVTARAKTDGELLWSHPATGYAAAIRGDDEVVVWTSASDRTGKGLTTVFATHGFDEPEAIATLEGLASDLVLTEDALYVLHAAYNSNETVVRLERPGAP